MNHLEILIEMTETVRQKGCDPRLETVIEMMMKFIVTKDQILIKEMQLKLILGGEGDGSKESLKKTDMIALMILSMMMVKLKDM